MKHPILFLFAIISLSFSSCSVIKDGKPSIEQGVFGKVLWLEGNVMPSVGVANSNTGSPAKRTVHIYEVTRLTQTEGQSPLFTTIKTKLIASVQTDKDGYFQCKLLPGKYSIFTVEEDGKFFANLFEGNGEIAPFEVTTNKVTTYNININYKAFY